MPRKHTYTRLLFAQDQPEQSDYEEDQGVSFINGHMPHTKTIPRWAILTLLVSIVSLDGAAILFVASYTILFPSDIKCAMQLSSYSPMLEAVEYYEVDWANEFRQGSIYRGQPTPELENAWEQLWRHDDINVPLDKLHMLNRSMGANWKKTQPEYGGGVEANVEVFHQLHCLNMIRQYTYLDSYKEAPEGFKHSAEMSRIHVDHCIETLRIALMCSGDVTPVLIKLDDTKPLGAEADFSSHHKCRRFDRLTDWMKSNAVEAVKL